MLPGGLLPRAEVALIVEVYPIGDRIEAAGFPGRISMAVKSSSLQ